MDEVAADCAAGTDAAGDVFGVIGSGATATDGLLAAGANGKVFQWNLAQLLPVSDTEKPLIFHSQPENVIFENISGFFMNHVRFADSHTDWSEDFRKKIEQYAENS